MLAVRTLGLGSQLACALTTSVNATRCKVPGCAYALARIRVLGASSRPPVLLLDLALRPE